MRPSASFSSLSSRKPTSPSPQAPVLPVTASDASTADAAMKSIFAKASQAQDTSHVKRNVILGVIGVILLAFFVLPSLLGPGDIISTHNVRRAFPSTFRLAVIADLDKRSKTGDGSKALYHSIYMTGTLTRSTGSSSGGEERYSVEWDAPAAVTTAHNEAGRGAELSELVLFQRRLLTFDDRTGIMFEVVNFRDSGATGKDRAPALVPRQIMMEGDGVTDKGMKIEWATVKGDHLYVGSFGKEYTSNDGEILHANNLWVKVMTREGVIQHVNWSEYYTKMRRELGYEHPGYLLHEAVTWSPHHQRWYVLPRRMSRERYDDVTDERKGANTMITAAPDFSDMKAQTVGRLTPERGFSTFKFLPGSGDNVIVAIKSAEEAATDRQTAYITVYKRNPADDSWKVVMEETEIPGDAKFEGLEVIDPDNN